MKMKVTEGEAAFLEKIRRTKEHIQEGFSSADSFEFLSRSVEEITRYVLYEILRTEE